ncbi:MAG: DUF1192 domain-containing protein [Pseudomonadota bacterium]
MFDEELPRKTGDALEAAVKEDLDPLSIEQLEERIKTLTAEIERTKADMARKTSHRSAAEALFKS